jgi:hypothetical protein
MDHFEDGFGRRHHVVSAAKEPVDVLALRRELTAVPGFEAALRERIEQLSRVQHPSFVRVRGLARLAKLDADLAIVSDRADGMRLSQLLERGHSLETGGALALTGQLIDALAALHAAPQTGAGAATWHGTLAAERLLLTRDGRLLIVEHVLGRAVRTLPLSAKECWTQLRVVAPAGGVSALDQRSDVAQAGAVALALLVGRPLGDGYPDRIGVSAPGSTPLAVRTAIDLLPDDVSRWLSKALQLAGAESFATADEARLELAPILAAIDDAAARRAVQSFVSDQPPAVPSPRRTAAPSPARGAAPEPEPARAVAAVAEPVAARLRARRLLVPMTRRTIGIAAAILILLTTGGAFAAKRLLASPDTAGDGMLAVTTNPPGASVVIDGAQRGHSPLTLSIASGDHVLQVGLDGASRTVPVSVAAGAQLSEVIDLPKAVAATGELQIRTEPSGARVLVDGQRRGTSPLTVDDLLPGVHMVTVEGQLGSVTQDVTVESGGVASLVVPLNAPEGVPVSGWIAVTAPVDVQLFEKGQLLGSSRSERIMASVGKHDLVILNDALGYRATRTVTVTAGQVSPVKVEPPKGSVSVNAVPWAEVSIDGERAGETPIGNLQLPIGPHEIVFHHPDLGDQRSTVTVTLTAPLRVSADLRRKP